MKKIIIAAIAAAAFIAAASAKELKVLTIGNSFADSVFTYLPKIAKAQGEDLVLERANHGGCELDRHWSYVEREEADPDVKLYRGNRKKLREILASRDWDIVTIQQASHKSWIADSYFPYAQYLYDYVKKHAPQAEVVIQQTWSYRCDDGRFGNGQWKITQKQMYEKLSDAYAKAAEKLGVRRIPSGLAVEKAREMQPYSYKPSDPAARKSLLPPDLPPQAGAIVGNFYWKKNPKTGELELKNDSIHLSNRGQYLQACVWYGFLFGKDPKDIKYVPDSIGDKDAEMLRGAASAALKEMKQPAR